MEAEAGDSTNNAENGGRNHEKNNLDQGGVPCQALLPPASNSEASQPLGVDGEPLVERRDDVQGQQCLCPRKSAQKSPETRSATEAF